MHKASFLIVSTLVMAVGGCALLPSVNSSNTLGEVQREMRKAGFELWYPAEAGIGPGEIWFIDGSKRQSFLERPGWLKQASTNEIKFATLQKTVRSGIAVNFSAPLSIKGKSTEFTAILNAAGVRDVDLDFGNTQIYRISAGELGKTDNLAKMEEVYGQAYNTARTNRNWALLDAVVVSRGLRFTLHGGNNAEVEAKLPVIEQLLNTRLIATNRMKNSVQWVIPSTNFLVIGYSRTDPAVLEQLPRWDPNRNGQLGTKALSFIELATSMRASKTILPDKPLPSALNERLQQFEAAWSEAGFLEKRQQDQNVLFEALTNCVSFHRDEENSSLVKNNSLKWADAAIEYYKELADPDRLTKSMIFKANIFYDLVQGNHTDGERFLRLAGEGEKLMVETFQYAPVTLKPQVLRVWSKFLYALARPQSFRLSEDWDNAFLLSSFARIKTAYDIEPSEIKNATQLARTVQRTAANPPQDSDPAWLTKMEEAYNIEKAAWELNKDRIAAPESRIPPLNIIAVLGMDFIVRRWEGCDLDMKRRFSSEFLRELKEVIIAAQSEVLTSADSAGYRNYRFDIYYDLGRMYAVAYGIQKTFEPQLAEGLWRQTKDNMRKCFAHGTAKQLHAALTDLERHPTLSLLTAEEKDELRSIFRGN